MAISPEQREAFNKSINAANSARADLKFITETMRLSKDSSIHKDVAFAKMLTASMSLFNALSNLTEAIRPMFEEPA